MCADDLIRKFFRQVEVDNKITIMKTIRLFLLGLIAVAALTSSALAQSGDGWRFSVGGEYSPNIKLSLAQPGAYYGNPPHPLGLGTGPDEMLDSVVLNDPAPGSSGGSDKVGQWGARAWLSKTWKLDDANRWGAGLTLGGTWHPLEGSATFGSVTGKDVIHYNVSTGCGCADVSDWTGSVKESVDGNLWSLYPGLRIEYNTPINKAETVFLTLFGEGGASFNWLTGSGNYTESIWSSKNSTPVTLADSRSGGYSGSDFNIGAFAQAGVRIGGKTAGLEVGYRYDFRDDLELGLAKVGSKGHTVFAALSFQF